MEKEMIVKLIKNAYENLKNSYAPYSNFNVSASLLTKSGKIFNGVNIENVSYPAGVCAEYVAVSKAVSEGEKDFEAIAIVCSKKMLCYPCGKCRQFLAEFKNDIDIIIAKDEKEYEIKKLSQLLPNSFNF